MPAEDKVSGELYELGWGLYRHTVKWIRETMPEGYSAREVLTVMGIAFGSVAFLLIDRSKEKVTGHKYAWAGEEPDVKVRARMAKLIRRHRDWWPKSEE